MPRHLLPAPQTLLHALNIRGYLIAHALPEALIHHPESLNTRLIHGSNLTYLSTRTPCPVPVPLCVLPCTCGTTSPCALVRKTQVRTTVRLSTVPPHPPIPQKKTLSTAVIPASLPRFPPPMITVDGTYSPAPYRDSAVVQHSLYQSFVCLLISFESPPPAPLKPRFVSCEASSALPVPPTQERALGKWAGKRDGLSHSPAAARARRKVYWCIWYGKEWRKASTRPSHLPSPRQQILKPARQQRHFPFWPVGAVALRLARWNRYFATKIPRSQRTHFFI